MELSTARSGSGIALCSGPSKVVAGVARVSGHVYTVDPVKFSFIKRPEIRTRLISIISGDLLVNVIPPEVDLSKVVYKQERKAVRVTDGSDWHLDISEYTWM